jgi:hypothetical protein
VMICDDGLNLCEKVLTDDGRRSAT